MLHKELKNFFRFDKIKRVKKKWGEKMSKILDLGLNKDVEELLNKELLSLKNPFFSVFSSLSEEEKRRVFAKSVSSGFQALMADYDLVFSLIELFKHNLCVNKTSRDSFIHRNTLTYRLDKIKRLSGLDVKNFYDAQYCLALMFIYFEAKILGLNYDECKIKDTWGF